VHQIYSQMQVGQAKFGMQTFNQALAALLARKQISMDEAFGRTSDAEELKNIVASGGGGNLPGQNAGVARPPGPPGR
jgi:twitching motility protein PilT